MGFVGFSRGSPLRMLSASQFQAVASCLCYAFCSTMLTIANKAIFSEQALNYPWTLLAIQSIFCAVLLTAYYGFTSGQWPVKRALLLELWRPCAMFTLYIFTNARALRYISLPLLSVVKSLAPMGIAVVERFLYNEKISSGTYGAMCLILLSNAVTVLNDIEFHLWGYIWAALNAVFNILYVVALRYFVTNKYSSGEKTLHNNIIISFIIIPVAFAAGEVGGFMREFAMTSLRFRLLFAMSCLLAVGIGASVFWVLQATSGSTLSFVGGANKVMVVILGALLFEVHISSAGWVGVGLGVLASISFTVSKARGSRAAKASPAKLPTEEPKPEPSTTLSGISAASYVHKVEVRSNVTSGNTSQV